MAKADLESHIAKYEYIEGLEATANFERVARAVFQAKKTVVQAKTQPKKKAAPRKSSGRHKA
jgi:hypothetical protein